MRKAFVLVLVVFCALSVFASNNVLSFRFTPIGMQISTSSDEPGYNIQSEFGIGAELSYRRYVSNRVFISGGIAWNSYDLPEDRPWFTSVMPFAGAGIECLICDLVKATLTAGVGLDSLFYDGLLSESITLKTGIDFDFIVEENVEFVLGCGGTFGFAKKTGTDYVNYRIVPEFGINIGL